MTWRNWPSTGGSGDVDGDLAEKFSVGLEDLDAAIAAVGDVDIILRVDGDAVRGVEPAGLVAGFAKRFEPVAIFVGFGDAGIDVAVADVGVAGCIPRHIGDLAKQPVDGRKRRGRVLKGSGALV